MRLREGDSKTNMARLLVGGLGLALWWPLLRRPACFFVLAGHDASIAACRAWFALFALVVLALALALDRLSARVPALPAHTLGRVRLSVICVFAAQLVLKLAGMLWPLPGAFGAVLAAADVVLFALVFVCLTCAWALWCVHMSFCPRLATCAASFAASFFVRSIAGLATGLDGAIMATTPMLSLLCALVALRPHVQNADDTASATVDAREVSAGRPTRPLTGMAGMLALFLVIAAVTRSMAFGQLSGALLSPVPSLQDALTIALAGVVLCYGAFHTSFGRLSQFVWPLATLVLFAGLFLMANAAMGVQRAGEQIMVVGRTILGLLFWLVLAEGAHGGGGSAVRSLAVPFVAVDAVSSLLGYVVVPGVLSLLGMEAADLTTVLASVVTFVLVMVSVVFFGRTLGGQAAPASESSAPPDAPVADGTPASRPVPAARRRWPSSWASPWAPSRRT